MTIYTIKPLGPDTWDDFARLIERQGNGSMGAPFCWCTNFHPPDPDDNRSSEGRRAYKEQLVSQGRAHAALVFDGDLAVGWCQYGSPEELPGIHHRKDYEAGLVTLPHYRLTCIYVDKAYRKRGVAAAALQGALDLIGNAGGGVVEGYPHDIPEGKKMSASFLYNLTRSVYEQAGFTYQRPKGKGNCVMTITVPPH
ncbi:MAG: GNAT family N-acetyltransferase [Acidimicrobiaceae bacterium]|jgi:GNAT superfamily N-acetyltransferase|nr:GNAT family N-acetyltransferase [Acidimicrobiaceae bacterium]